MIYAVLMTPEEIAAAVSSIYKYVRMADDSVRFADIQGLPDHWQMVEDDEHPKSAGTVAVEPRAQLVKTVSYGSSTLGLKSADDDEEVIAKLIFLPKSAQKPTKRKRSR